MPASVSGQYHQVRFDGNGRRALWNPINKKRYAFRPEEQVRLQVVDFLHYNCGYPLTRISTEPPVKVKGRDSSLRADVVAFGRDMKPELLVECKAPEVKTGEAAAIQAARYNEVIGAAMVLLTNGHAEYLFRIGDGRSEQIPVSEIIKTENPARDESYWKNRGFPVPETEAVSILMNALYHHINQPIFLHVPDSVNGFDLSHYYIPLRGGSKNRCAAALCTDHRGQDWLNILMARNGSKTAAVSVNLSGFSILLDGDPVKPEIDFEKIIHGGDPLVDLHRAAENIVNLAQRQD